MPDASDPGSLARPEQIDWVARVLGVAFARGNAGPVDWDGVRQIWLDAIEATNGQIAALQSALKAEEDEDLNEIGEFGLNAITGGMKTQMMAAMMQLGRGAPDAQQKASAAALTAVERFRKFVDTDTRIAACDENPFGVKMTLRATLTAAFNKVGSALQSRLA